MSFREILDLLIVTLGVTGIGAFFYFYFTNVKVKYWTNTIVNRIPLAFIFNLMASKVEDQKGKFDTHDALVVAGRLSDFIKNTVVDPSNTNFEDIEDEVFEFMNSELDRYRKAGVSGVPDISDAALRINIKVVFEQIVRALSEDPS